MRVPRLPRGERDPNPAASMALLEEVLDPPVGPGYHSAARQREEAGLPASSGTRTWLMWATSILIGLVGTVAVVTLRTPDPAAAEGRAQIIARIEAAQTAGDDARETVDLLRADIVDLERRAQEDDPAGTADGSSDRIAAAGLQAGAQALVGPGVVVVLSDATVADAPPGSEVAPERVNARDVQLVVNGLWSAGAEAVSVNDHRLTSTSAIRFAGEAIIVDFRGLAPPYEIRAIGDPDALAAETSSGLTGAYLAELRGQLRIGASVTTSAEVTVPAAERLTTRVGEVSEPGGDDDQVPGEPPGAATTTKDER